ncbi:FAD-dependent pyridine nucleotide-disulfide oxidoreductase [Caballeronia catudaia]|uniref:FAD-dependent pyridine nucleotide-disulfide oxidoreductase n=1 Tax=Caballeronia catudaia TaxID=1777136 RepID=A0A158DHB7_9BURK|nr:FAD-dependent pyridine nucleotide-disulfide oxidoreductase [Caballeronia catudaia]
MPPAILHAGRIPGRATTSVWNIGWSQSDKASLLREIFWGGERFPAVPFFWSQQYNTVIHYVGHAEHWDRVDVDGDPVKYDCTVIF